VLKLDINSALSPRVAGGLQREDLRGLYERLSSGIDALRAGGDFTGWVDLPLDEKGPASIEDWARGLPAVIDRVVVMGIGGSSLGPMAVYEAIHQPSLAAGIPLASPARPLIFLDNSDPDTVGEVMEAIAPERTLYVVITKSGSTAETASQLMIAHDHASAHLKAETADHFVFVTDPEKGDLRKLAGRLGVRSFSVPPTVGGRFSVLSAVGLVPCAVAGIDPNRLVAGARVAREACLVPAPERNPAAKLAALAYLMDTRQGRRVHTLMSYSDRLARVGSWFRQLWAESLGKIDGDGRHVGPTPLDARGATDQHSLLQLLVQGPPDKLVIMLDVASRRRRTIPRVFDDLDAFGYLGGHTLGELIDAQRRGTEASLARAGTPSVTITLEAVEPESVGAVMYLLEVTTALAGTLYGIDPYDQPGVEQGKRVASGLLGREGFEKDGELAESHDRSRDPDLVMEI
jgi:glucose-6-phosphate isomerase